MLTHGIVRPTETVLRLVTDERATRTSTSMRNYDPPTNWVSMVRQPIVRYSLPTFTSTLDVGPKGIIWTWDSSGSTARLGAPNFSCCNVYFWEPLPWFGVRRRWRLRIWTLGHMGRRNKIPWSVVPADGCPGTCDARPTRTSDREMAGPLVLFSRLGRCLRAFARRDPRATHLLPAPFGPPSTANTFAHT